MKSEAEYAATGKSSPWNGVAAFFKKQRRLAWETVRILTDGQKKKRKDFRMRHTVARLRNVGKVLVVCSEFKKRRKGRKRKFFACSYLKATPWQVLTAYRIRWKIEIFHKHVKINLGFEDVAAKHFDSVESHVYLVYCAYILLNAHPPGVPESAEALCGKQQYIETVPGNGKTASVLQKLTQIGGAERYREELKSVLENGGSQRNLTGKYAGVL